jgi:predicted patatin/cPLA2 family phospholipase
MPSLVLEGGTFRPIFSSGVMDALLDMDLMFPYCIGVSAGISDGLSYVSRQRGRNLELMRRYRNDKRYLGLRNYFKCGSIFGLDFVFDEIPNKLLPFDMKTFMAYEGTFLVGVTNALTGRAEYLNGKEMDEKSSMIRATCALPLFFPAIMIDGVPYYDGGIADSIPVAKAVQDGNEKHLIILTQPKGFVKRSSRRERIVARRMGQKYPQFCETLEKRPENYNHSVALCEQLEREGKALILRPEQPLNSFEKDVSMLEQTYMQGYKMARAREQEIRSLFE